MRGKGGGFGLVILVVVVAVVLLLAAKAWQAVAPEATEIVNPTLHELQPGGAGGGESSSDLPGLQDAREETSAHAERLREALEQTQ
jgi:hypothetical protein